MGKPELSGNDFFQPGWAEKVHFFGPAIEVQTGK
jgi:hypothetical protein